jgi:hypothetical protein
LRKPLNSRKAPPAAIFLSGIFLLKTWPTGKYLPGAGRKTLTHTRQRDSGSSACADQKISANY